MKPISQLVQQKGAIQDRSIYWDDDIYQKEMKEIFARCWLFLTHDAVIPKEGDYQVTTMGEDNVIVARQKDGSVKAFLNSCTHRGNYVCFSEGGHTRSFVCPYHGWSFGIDGALNDVPLEEQAYFNDIDREALGLQQIRVESYKGFLFGTFDNEAPSLVSYLGGMAWYLDSFMDVPGGVELIGPPMKSILNCNWKNPSENFIGDGYHVGWAHASALEIAGGALASMKGLNDYSPDSGIQVTVPEGHGFGAIWDAAAALHPGPPGVAYQKWLDKRSPAVEKIVGKTRTKFYNSHWNATIFPNCSFLYGTNTFKVWQPRGPRQIEVFTWTLVEKEMPEELKQMIHSDNMLTFGTAGILESDDGENFENCTHSNRGYSTRQGKLYLGMGRGLERTDSEMPGLVSDGWVNEMSTRGMYRRWAELMEGRSWSDLSTTADLMTKK
ncbi:MAG: naphthalene 1,2-dioxygenase [Piscirickettsiaceae bacterium]|nr:MAG: naphthalene 1,2-dioxygenase [Piscirickettsiaceae bacterium]PCI65617.1 MAG: naphthalene 1,2-dioxygenase [Piscirickettsiaceae bacterium]